MNNKPEPKYINGIWSYELKENTPNWVISRTAYKVDEFINALQAAKQYAINGWVTVEVRLSEKTGKRYAVLDTYEFEKKQGQPNGQASGYEKFQARGQQLEENLPVIDVNDEPLPEEPGLTQKEINDLPF